MFIRVTTRPSEGLRNSPESRAWTWCMNLGMWVFSYWGRIYSHN